MISTSYISINKTARYSKIGEANLETKLLWIVIHGYGQLAEDFIKNFENLTSDSTVIIAPEALNKFYLRGFSGKIGATWMTKEERVNEIKDYTNFINEVFVTETKFIDFNKCKINVLGFSQGTHTAVRWLDIFKPKINNLILWSGSFPRDCNYYHSIDYWKALFIKVVVGQNDKMVSPEALQENIKFFNQLNLNLQIEKFDGGHEIDKNLLLKLNQKFQTHQK